ncbi:FAD-dependent oxidoreductase [Hyphomicrobium sp. CS1BSMeth3]|uniref:NAD(P)/FAD-dependent oxidoreductase n=1 Tax=Hyphomicrobium sp. CS1BSMeth3 TaxID=1892844 RepID=UPI000931C9D4|nr:FAD-dependent oxidoreductase [Hyphomicrobium sp. CS1BSMeth3]
MSILIIGAGHAGGAVAANLRQLGSDAPITIIGDEPYLPYQRPPLSKAWLKSDVVFAAVGLRPQSYYEQRGITLRLDARASSIDRGAHTITLASGETLGYRTLILATGARARRLGLVGEDLPNVHVLRTIADADHIKAALVAGRRLVVIGGGYIGLEVAASARLKGMDVLVVEREARLLARVASPPISAFMQSFHERQGVRFQLETGVTGFDVRDGRVAGVQLSSGETAAADMVLVGVGAVPNTELAQAAGITCSNGIAVDLEARTSDPDIFAIGDCTERPLLHYSCRARLESVASALEQARQAAAAICGGKAPAPEVPWFWSDQYDLKLQIAGLPIGATRIDVRGDMEQGKFAVAHLDGEGRLCAVEAVNAPAEYMAGRATIGKQRAG